MLTKSYYSLNTDCCAVFLFFSSYAERLSQLESLNLRVSTRESQASDYLLLMRVANQEHIFGYICVY